MGSTGARINPDVGRVGKPLWVTERLLQEQSQSLSLLLNRSGMAKRRNEGSAGHAKKRNEENARWEQSVLGWSSELPELVSAGEWRNPN